jgi:RimJ/RimL family protein N-acetyltransferase
MTEAQRGRASGGGRLTSVAAVALAPVRERDVALVHELMTEPASTGESEWYGWRDPHALRRRWDGDGLLGDGGGMLMVVADDEPVGFVAWTKHRTTRISHCWTIGLALRPDARGKGIGTSAQRLLADYLFAHTLANRVEAVTGVTNLAEQRALEKAGFTREGVLRGYGFQGGRWRDGVLYSVLRGDRALG